MPNLAARNLASNRSRLVATVVPSISTSVFAETVTAANEVLAPAGYQLILGFSDYNDDQEEQLVRQLVGRRPDGVFLIGNVHTDASVHMLRSSGVPVVETWGWSESPIDDQVGFSNHDAVVDLVTAVHDLGYRNPVFAGSLIPGDHRSRERIAGFRTARSTLTPGSVDRFVDSSDLPLTLESGALLLDRMLRAFPDLDIVMFSTDILANGALLAAQRRGLRVPEDLGITGFGDFELSTALSPSLTTVSVPTAELGHIAAERLLEKMEGRARGQAATRVAYKIAIRETTRRQ
ncbi:substrate-binding domain-containing protein [Leucobacter sp. M11]|nr:substrate-binding domain-containing protein [Leucobacter sp. M11]